ncbi:MAG: PQQ-binding-like beta-propeller repeat protein [Verrucomicrobiaceae bacterium]|nr:PQQ-binding-like beta-propeller repeat protein [Verrucomicrobiaceae bacterium]
MKKLVLGWIGGVTLAVHAADWPQFLGPDRDGVAAPDEKAIAGAAEAEILWKRPLGSGFAGPVVMQDRVIIFHRQADEMVIEALQAADGKPVWRSSYPSDYRDSFGFDNGPRAVPAVAGGRIMVHGPEGRVVALAWEDGKQIWSFDTADEVGSPQGFFGRACAPLVMDGKVLLNVGGADGAGIIALDAASGRLLWKATPHEAGYAAGVAMPGDDSVAAFFTRNGISVIGVADGRVFADETFRADIDASVNAATPLACGQGRLFFSASYDVGGGVWQWDSASKRLANVWKKVGALDCHYSTPVAYEGHLYGFHGRQESGATLRCIAAADGGVRWEAPTAVPGGTLIRVKDHLLVVTEQGELWIVRATPEKFDLLRSTQILGARHRSHAAFSDGVLYARDASQLVAVRVR